MEASPSPAAVVAAAHERPTPWTGPRWLAAIDTAVLALLNAMLAVEVLLIFANTMARTLFNSSALMGVDETSTLFLVTIAFLGGAVAYSHGQFIAITMLVDRLEPGRRELARATAECVVIVIAALLGIYSRSEEHTSELQ